MNDKALRKITNQAVLYGFLVAVVVGGLVYLGTHNVTFAIIGASVAEFLTAISYLYLEIQKRRSK